MGWLEPVFIILILIVISAVVSSAEISLAGARKLKLQALVNEGNQKAEQVLRLQERPGRFITVVQIGLNMVAVLAGMLGESALTPYVEEGLRAYVSEAVLAGVASWTSFALVTFSFILVADLIPKRIAMSYPEATALKTVKIMQVCIFLLSPLVWIFDSIANGIFRLLRISTVREDSMTPEDIVAVVEAGAESGVLKAQEHYLIENIFDMQERTVTSTMTTRENIVFLDRTFDREKVLETLGSDSHSKLPICDGSLDKILGYVESHELLTMYLKGENKVSLTDTRLLRKPSPTVSP